MLHYGEKEGTKMGVLLSMRLRSGKQIEPITTRKRCCDRLIVNFHVRSVGVTTAVSSGCHELSNETSHKVFRF